MSRDQVALVHEDEIQRTETIEGLRLGEDVESRHATEWSSRDGQPLTPAPPAGTLPEQGLSGRARDRKPALNPSKPVNIGQTSGAAVCPGYRGAPPRRAGAANVRTLSTPLVTPSAADCREPGLKDRAAPPLTQCHARKGLA